MRGLGNKALFGIGAALAIAGAAVVLAHNARLSQQRARMENLAANARRRMLDEELALLRHEVDESSKRAGELATRLRACEETVRQLDQQLKEFQLAHDPDDPKRGARRAPRPGSQLRAPHRSPASEACAACLRQGGSLCAIECGTDAEELGL